MSINETQYKINMKALQRVLAMIHSTPAARLEIEPHRAVLTISGEYAWVAHGVNCIAGVLDRTAARFFEKIDDAPVEPSLKIPGDDGIGGEETSPPETPKPNQPFVVVVQSDDVCDYIPDAAESYQVDESVVQAVVAPYEVNECFTIVFNLDGSPPRVLPNSEKGQLN